MKSTNEETRLDLLCKQAVYGLTESEIEQLQELEKNADSSVDSQSLELTAAAISMVGLEIEPMPAHLESKILASFDKQLVMAKDASELPVEENIFTRPRQPVDDAVSGSSLWNWFPWAVAAAACVVLAVNIFTSRPTSDIADGPKPTPTIEQILTPAQLRQQLIETTPDIARAEWGKGNVAEIDAVNGDVVWSDTKQAGYLRVRGLPANDPTKETYQLWIFEDGKLEPHPKDGGVFDVNTSGEVIIPIDAKIATKDPKVFAITIEKPGGVVVSSREKIAALAKSET
ncbi:hypothetical protein BH24ACI3_BH24ACI3_04680 [soil metagenome]